MLPISFQSSLETLKTLTGNFGLNVFPAVQGDAYNAFGTIGHFTEAYVELGNDLKANPRAVIVIDDLASTDPWAPRGVSQITRMTSASSPCVVSTPSSRAVRFDLPCSSRKGTIVVSTQYGLPSLARFLISPCQTLPLAMVVHKSRMNSLG